MAPDIEPLGDAVGPDRRTFVKGLVVGTVFAAPIVSSFTMAGIGSVFGGVSGASIAMANSTTAPNGFINPLIYMGNVNGDGSISSQNFTDVSVTPFAIGNVVAAPNTFFFPPADNVFRVFRADQGFLEGQLGSGYTYLYGVAVTWVGPDAFPTGVQLTLTHPSFEEGDEVFLVAPDGSTSPYSATVTDGQAVVTFTQDPGFVVARAQVVPPTTDSGPATAVGADPNFTG